VLFLLTFARFPMQTCSDVAAMDVNRVLGCISKSAACGRKRLFISVWYVGGHTRSAVSILGSPSIRKT